MGKRTDVQSSGVLLAWLGLRPWEIETRLTCRADADQRESKAPHCPVARAQVNTSGSLEQRQVDNNRSVVS